MSRQTSTETGKRYGLERICRVLEFARSTLYAQQARESAKVVCLHRKRRGPQPKVSDADLLAAIRTDLETSPFTGEGHRKVWARLRIGCNIRVSRARVLRLMRENALLSPHRRPQGEPIAHDSSIQTDRPNEMWGTDGIRIETLDEGWVWVFSAIDRFDACCSRHPHGQDRQPPCRLAADCPGDSAAVTTSAVRWDVATEMVIGGHR